MSGSHLDRGAERRRLLRAIDVDDDPIDDDRDGVELERVDASDGIDLAAPTDEEPIPAPVVSGPRVPSRDSVGTERSSEPRSPRTALAVRPFLEESTEDGDA